MVPPSLPRERAAANLVSDEEVIIGFMPTARQISRANMLTPPVPVVFSIFLFQFDCRETTLEQCSATTPGHPKSIPNSSPSISNTSSLSSSETT